MQTVKENGVITEVYLTKKEFSAFQIISLNKDLGVPSNQILKELNKNKISPKETRNGNKAYLFEKKGAEIIEGKGYNAEPMGLNFSSTTY